MARSLVPSPLAAALLVAACGSEPSARFVELPPSIDASTVILGRSFRTGAALTHATVYDRTKGVPVVYEHAWDPGNAEVLSAYFYRATIHQLDLATGELDPPPLGQESAGRTLRTPDTSFELVLEDGVDTASWGPATLGLLGRYLFYIPPIECPEGQHDGGDRTCVLAGQCASGFRDGGGGTCVVPGTCARTYYVGRDGDCVPACPVGYYVSITGLCCGDKAQIGSGDCIEACTVGQQRSPSSTQGCVPDSWCCDGLSCAAPPC